MCTFKTLCGLKMFVKYDPKYCRLTTSNEERTIDVKKKGCQLGNTWWSQIFNMVNFSNIIVEQRNGNKSSPNFTFWSKKQGMDGLYVMISPFEEPFGNEVEEHGRDVE